MSANCEAEGTNRLSMSSVLTRIVAFATSTRRVTGGQTMNTTTMYSRVVFFMFGSFFHPLSYLASEHG